jgi:hypothetical protein
MADGSLWWMASGTPCGHRLSPGYPKLFHNVVHKLCAYARVPGNQPVRACCLMRLVSSVTWV